MSEITRNGVEKALLEFTGFKGDQAVIDGLMVVIEAWAVQQAEGLAASPGSVREGHVHLLVQQAELLLDSAGRLQLASTLAEQVKFLTGLTDGMQDRMQDLADKVAEIAGKQEMISLAPPEPVATETLQGWLDEDDGKMPGWERELIERQLADRIPGDQPWPVREDPVSVPEDSGSVTEADASDRILDEIFAEIKAEAEAAPPRVIKHRKPAPMPFERDGDVLLHCGGCERDKPLTEFFLNSKSASGYESKCKSCRKAKAA